MELDCYPMWIGVRRAVRDGWKTAVVGEPGSHGNRVTVKERRPAERLRFWRSFEAPLNHNTLGVIGSESMVLAIRLVHGINDFGLHPRIIRQSIPRHRDGHEG